LAGHHANKLIKCTPEDFCSSVVVRKDVVTKLGDLLDKPVTVSIIRMFACPGSKPSYQIVNSYLTDS
jgi:hypothetical protein